MGDMSLSSRGWRWALGLGYIVAVAIIWIAASFVVRSVVGEGVSPFLLTYICNSLFIIYLPLVEIRRFVEDYWSRTRLGFKGPVGPGEFIILQDTGDLSGPELGPGMEPDGLGLELTGEGKEGGRGVDGKGRWTRSRVAKASIVVCPFWFLAQLTFNLSLKYTTVTSNTILSSASSLFTYLVALVWLEERFVWVKLVSVLLCMAGTIVVSLGDSDPRLPSSVPNPILGDAFALISAALYALYVTLLRRSLPSDEYPDPPPDLDPNLEPNLCQNPNQIPDRCGRASTAQFLGFMGLFNLLLFLPVALFLVNSAYALNWNQLCLILGKGLLDNVLSDYLWAMAVLLTSATVATAGLTIQVPLAAVVDSFTGNPPTSLDYVGAAAVLLGFVGINLPADNWFVEKGSVKEPLEENIEEAVEVS